MLTMTSLKLIDLYDLVMFKLEINEEVQHYVNMIIEQRTNKIQNNILIKLTKPTSYYGILRRN